MDFDEIMELMKESADNIADPSPEDYPELGREERERMFAMSENKYNNTAVNGISEEKSEIEVKGVERYHRPVWHRFASIAAAVALIAGLGGGAYYLKNGSFVKDPRTAVETIDWDYQAVAGDLTGKWLEFCDYCYSSQTEINEDEKLTVEYKYTDGSSAANVDYYPVTNDRFASVEELNAFVSSFASETVNGELSFGVRYEDITPVEKPASDEPNPMLFIRVFVEKDGKLYMQKISGGVTGKADFTDDEIVISDIPENPTEGSKFTAKRSVVLNESSAATEYTFTFILRNGEWSICGIDVISEELMEGIDGSGVAVSLSNAYITLLNQIEDPVCDENDVIKVYCEVPEGLTADNFETPEQYYYYLEQKESSCQTEFVRMTDFGNEEDMRRYALKYMDEAEFDYLMSMQIAGRYASGQVVDGIITENYDNYSATIGHSSSTYANLITVDGVLYARRGSAKTTAADDVEVAKNGYDICFRRQVTSDNAEEYQDGYMYFVLSRLEGEWKITLTGEKAYWEYMSAIDAEEQATAAANSENKPAAGDEHNKALSTDEDIRAMAVDLTDGFVDLRNISEFGLTADTNDSFAGTDIGYYYYRVTDSRFTDTASLISYARSILSEELETSDPKLTISSQCGSIAEKGPDAVAFTDNNGVLYTRSAHNSDIRAFEYKSDAVEISDVERDSAGNATSFTASRQVVYWDVTEPVMYNFTVKNTDAGWRITDYSKTGGYEETAAELLKAVRSLRGEAMETEGEELIYTQYFGNGADLHREGATPGEYAVYSYYPVKGSLTLDILRGKAHSVFTDECISNHEGIATNKLDDMKLFGGDTSAYGSGYTWASEDEAAFAPDLGVFIEYNGRLYVLANGSSWLLDPGEKNTAAEVLEGRVRYATDDKFELYVNVEPSDETYGLSIVTYNVVKQDGQWKISDTGLSTGAM